MRETLDDRIEKLNRLHTEANVLEEQLQRKVFEIDFLRMSMESRGEMISMVKVQRLAMELRLLRDACDIIAAEG